MIQMNKVLILGSGMVAKPMVEYLLNNGFSVVIASPLKEKADQMINGHPAGQSVDWSMDEPEMLEKLVSLNDIVVSLLPFQFHVNIALICLNYRKPLVTTSYVQVEMQMLDDNAKKAGVILLNEIGLDPGIDHMSAMRLIDYIHDRGGKVEMFCSLGGALPAPESADNPLKYKFTWSPKGVISASTTSAVYLKKGEIIKIKSKDLFKNRFAYSLAGIDNLEVYPNRDSTTYIDVYGIPEASTMYRGTIRYKGWCETLDAMNSLNMLERTIADYKGKSYVDFIAERANLSTENIKQNVAKKLYLEESSVPVTAFEWLGFFENKIMNYREATPFDITSDAMIKKMILSDDERDMTMLQHIILASYPDGKKEVIRSSMIDYGNHSTNTSIARTVSLPAAIAVKLILEKKITLQGVYRPTHPEIYNPVLDELHILGIEMKEEYGLPESEMIKI